MWQQEPKITVSIANVLKMLVRRVLQSNILSHAKMVEKTSLKIWLGVVLVATATNIRKL
jgi:hypothetical protein